MVDFLNFPEICNCNIKDFCPFLISPVSKSREWITQTRHTSAPTHIQHRVVRRVSYSFPPPKFHFMKTAELSNGFSNLANGFCDLNCCHHCYFLLFQHNKIQKQLHHQEHIPEHLYHWRGT